MYFINSDENLIYEAVGYRVPNVLIEAGVSVKESGKRYLELIGLFNTSKLTEAQTEEFFTLLTKFEQKELLLELAGEKVKSFAEEDVLKIENKALLMAAGGSILSLPVKTALKNAASMKLAWGEQDFNTYLSEAFNSSMQIATETSDSLVMESIVSEFVPVYMIGNPGRIPEAQLTTRKIYFSEVNDWESYIQAVEKHYNDIENGNLRFLYLECYYIVENQLFDALLLDKSNEWIEKVILAQPGFDSYFLAAIINTYRENDDSILKYLNLAESVAVSQDEKDSLEELKRYLEDQ
jgi:hypothetical protein